MPTPAQLDAWLDQRPPARYLAAQQPSYAVTFTRADGTGGGYIRHGGSATEHAAEAAQVAGPGASVTVDRVAAP